ncbi:FAD/NAD(P)-binding domain-containing protein [Aspergillus phoenicis ATCC 13157]|uniref:FAD/NAD(P)-binding domain-containing protein n=1 Tax=Aspergillus phoenicis ATCC 13157 TaxID=1353007 RepID=A0A370PWJ1_ASPPH|nr:FAD/NAD(P)-binding domain-containing protein [Aspergillus phoenicis ATCC 13157]
MASSYAATAIIIGAGPSGIAMAYRLKHELGFSDFLVYEKMNGVGGTWRGCDLPSHLYSFSFNLNPAWSKELCEQPEILQYIEDTVDKFDIRQHVITSVECLGAAWDDNSKEWTARFHDLKTGLEFERRATILVSAVGAISFPRDVKFKGMESFKGNVFHTARWDHSVDYTGKRVAVIGNGCSAAQVVPAVSEKAALVQQYARSAQWYHARPNKNFSQLDKWMFRWLPLWQRWLRLRIFLQVEREAHTYFSSEAGVRARLAAEEESREYILSRTPQQYKKAIGAKDEFTEHGIIGSSGVEDEFDIIVLATGFQVSEFLTPMEIRGRRGISLRKQWKESRGAQAYYGTFVHNFPNFGIIFGPNSFPANNSALFACETQVCFAIKALIEPILDHRTRVVEVKQQVEERHTMSLQEKLKGTVFAGGCSNWYINEYGRNAASWPAKAGLFWLETCFPNWDAFIWRDGSAAWPLYRLLRWLKVGSWGSRLGIAAVIATVLAQSGFIHESGIADRFDNWPEFLLGLSTHIVG